MPTYNSEWREVKKERKKEGWKKDRKKFSKMVEETEQFSYFRISGLVLLEESWYEQETPCMISVWYWYKHFGF
jgi:hypothetical protein